MEVSFEVKITPQILYDYLLYHMYSSLSGALGNIVGALFVVSFFMNGKIWYLIAGLIILCYLPWTLFLRAKKQYLSNPAFQEPIHYILGESGMEISQKEQSEHVSWDQMYKAISTQRSIILYTSPVNASIFPKRDLGEHIPALIEVLSTHMPTKKVKIRG